jgi:catechol 2,3-dioxygenase-like lactoylglutathione lyase family enzyme
VQLDNGVTLDFIRSEERIPVEHYAFLVSEEEFDEIFGRIRARGLDFWADPFQRLPGEINTHDGGRGVNWLDPDGHLLEIITRPYGG